MIGNHNRNRLTEIFTCNRNWFIDFFDFSITINFKKFVSTKKLNLKLNVEWNNRKDVIVNFEGIIIKKFWIFYCLLDCIAKNKCYPYK